ncbi:oligopeptidase A [Methylomagnum ishizawai]|uniref:oligopeptidase A n=1 Tax=Methylomagnum ishizawai TaxID=1760988 RepID=UPI001C3328A0|nr:oligopeptidase A [Methylomagnum ishizawai]BBL73411.1 oligopeptidase A [Methylomagnum ishizawai]
MSNPLLESHDLPPFSRILPEQVVPAITQLLADNRAAIAALLEPGKTYTWDNLVEPLEDLDDKLNRAWSPVGHMNSVVNSDALREAYNACLPLLSEYATEVGQNEALYRAYRAIADGPEFARLDPAQRKIIDNALRDFRLSGVDLPPEQKDRYKDIAQELSKLTSQFQDNLMDATQAWTKHIEDESLLAGLPDSAKAMARQAAAAKELPGWLFTLEFPSYIAILTYADHRELRQEFYTAYATRASETGPNAGQFDNTELMERILALRHEEAGLLGFANFAELSLATKMAPSTDEVVAFLTDLAERSLPHARRDLAELKAFAAGHLGLADAQSWDLTYASEKLRQHKFDLSEEEVRTYFPAPKAVGGMFAVVEKLYGLSIQAVEGVEVWHPEVTFYEIHDRDGQKRGAFYLDLYARPKKRGGAWMDECLTRRRKGDAVQTPVAFLTCNFTPPTGDDPALLRHDEVLTLFHEFGHGLQHMLTQVDHLGVSGIHGVEWDAVELPSQFMENFCWEPEALALISGHYQTGEPLPQALLDKMTAARNFQSGMQMVRQLEFSLFDFRMHREYDPAQGGRVYAILDEVRKQVAVVVPPAFNRFPHSFSHIFAGGYAAGYYSYKWAEVLSSDAYSLFEENGVFDADTGRAFMENILETGGSRKAMDVFVAFRGREPNIDALLRHNGIAEAA